jgi:hypothetical protein
MISEPIKAETLDFAEQLANLTQADLTVILSQWHDTDFQEYKLARDAAKRLSSSDFFWVEKRTGDAVNKAKDLRLFDPSDRNLTRACALVTGCAMIKRHKLTAEQYHILVDGFIAAGVKIPPHPSEET